jgi:hypothetical protein
MVKKREKLHFSKMRFLAAIHEGGRARKYFSML